LPTFERPTIAIVDYEDKVFEDIQAEPGEQAFILMHTVPFEGSVGLVNMLTATRINRKGFDTHLVKPADPAAWFLAGRTARRLGRLSQACSTRLIT
jgi:hypothetical protein